MTWLSDYEYRKKNTINATTAGAQTNYQLKLIVGESSGASGADVHCENHCLDFPNDIRFTKEDGETKHDYWVEKTTGITPNRKATVWIEVASIPASDSVDFYMYYYKTDDSGESDGDNTFEFFDDFEKQNSIFNGSGNATTAPPNTKIVRFGNKTHIVYVKYLGSVYKAYVRTYNHTTSIWESEVLLGNCYDNHACPAIVVDSNGYLYVFYDGHHVTMKWRKSTYSNDSSSWSAEEAIPYQANKPCYISAVVDSSNNIYIIYRQTEGPPLHTYYQKYNGSSWSSAIILFESDASYWAQYHCSLAIDGNDVLHAVAHWDKVEGGGGEVIGYAKSTDGGNTWKESDNTPYTLPITRTSIETLQTGTNIRADSIAVNSNNQPIISVCDRDTTPYSGRFWRYNGSAWVSTVISVSGKHIAAGGTCSFYNGITYVFASVGSGSNWEVYMFYSDDDGANFSQKQISTTDAANPNRIPQCERDVGGNTLSEMRVMWTNGDVDGATKIYFARIDASYNAILYKFQGGLSNWVEDPVYTGGNISIEESVVKIGSYSIKHSRDTGTSIFFNAVGTINSNVAIECYRQSAATDDDVHIILNQGQAHDVLKQVTMVSLYNTGKIRYHDGTWHDIMDYSADTWYRFKFANFNFTAYTFDIYINDVLKVTGANFRNNLSYFDNFQISAASAGTIGYIDMLLIRKYTSPEPTWGSWGDEEFTTIVRGFYHSKLGAYNFINPPDPDFNITTELNGIDSFDFVIQNNIANRTLINDHLTDDFKIMRGNHTILLTGSIDSDNIEYFAKGEGGAAKRIKLSGHANYVDLSYLIFKHMADADAENVGSVQNENYLTSTFTDYTVRANDDIINDVRPTFGGINDALYIGKDETFFSIKTKYSTKGIQAANTIVVIEYSKGSDVWATLDCIDESYAFTEDVGTYLFFIPNKADDWAKNTVNGKSKYWIRFRITQGSYTTPPKLDRIWLSNADVCRVQFNDVFAKTILGYILAGTGYNEDATDQCPSAAITIRGEYDSRLRWIFGIGNALTWEDGNGDKQRYDVWIDTSKKVHYKQQRGSDKGDISADFRAINNKMGYHGIGTRIFGAGSYEGINQKRAIVEDTTAQATHKLREIVLEDSRITGYVALKEETQKSLTIRKAPLKEVSGDIDTKYWLDHSLSVGDKITINQPDWNVNSQDLYIMRAKIDPSNTHLDLGTSQMHLEQMRSSLQRQMDINNVWMHGAVSTYVIGPEEDNYERTNDTTTHPVRFTIEVPNNARGINHVEIGWELLDYKSSITGSGSGGSHNHGGGVANGGDHDHVMSSAGLHWHTVGGAITYTVDLAVYWVYATGNAGGHSHTNPSTSTPSTVADVVYDLNTGDACVGSGYCITSADTIFVASSTHTHSQLNTGSELDHFHGSSFSSSYFVETIDDVTAWTTSQHNGHDHPLSGEPAHIHAIASESSHTHTVSYGIHEEAGGTTLELYINDVLVANNYVGDQSGINITGWISTGHNTVTLKPIVSNNVKGRAKISAMATIFVENLK